MSSKNDLCALMFGTMLLAGAVSAGANTIVYTEDFNAGGFLGSSLGDVGNFSERWINTDYYTVNNNDGWVFSGSSYLAKDVASGNQAVLLNEPSGVATHLSGLNPNSPYVLTFNLSGDNRPGLDYRFLLDINNVNVLDITSQWTTTTPAGHAETVQFTTDGTGQALLKFYQDSATQSSPIVDDIVVTTVPDGGTTVMLLGSALIGLWALRRKTVA